MSKKGLPQHRYTQEQQNFIREHISKISCKEVAVMFNKKFNTELSHDNIRKMAYYWGYSVYKTNKHYTPHLTGEQKEYIRQNVTGRYFSQLCDMFNDKYNTRFTAGQIKQIVKSLNLTCGMHHAPPPNTVPIGGVRLDTAGYVRQKCADGTWRLKHHVIYEAANGPIPENHLIIFADGDKHNFDLDNLIAVSKSTLLTMAGRRLPRDNAELTRASVAIAELYVKLKELDATSTVQQETVV